MTVKYILTDDRDIRTMRRWKYTLGDKQNPMNGRVTAEDGTLISLRAVANAEDEKIMRLIAAAPDMLAALELCESLLAELEDGGAENPELGIARAAIAKATGTEE